MRHDADAQLAPPDLQDCETGRPLCPTGCKVVGRARRSYMQSEHISEGLRVLLPKDDSKAVEKPAEAALRTRM